MLLILQWAPGALISNLGWKDGSLTTERVLYGEGPSLKFFPNFFLWPDMIWIIAVQCFDLRLQSTAFFHFKLAYSKWRRHNHIKLHENGFNKKVHTYFLKPRQFAIFILFYFHSTVFYIEWICVFPTQLKQTRIFFQLTVFLSTIIF